MNKTTIDMLPPEIIGLIGKTLDLENRRNMMIAHPCFLQANAEYFYQEWTISEGQFLSPHTNQSLRKKFDCLRRKKPRLQELEIIMVGRDTFSPPPCPVLDQMNRSITDIIYISTHTKLSIAIIVSNVNSIRELQCIFNIIDKIKNNVKIEVKIKINNNNLLENVYLLLKEFEKIHISIIIIAVEMNLINEGFEDYRHSFTNVLNQSFKNSVGIVQYSYSPGISPTQPPLNTQQIIIIDNNSLGLSPSSLNPNLWSFFNSHAQTIKCIVWKYLFTNNSMFTGYMDDLKELNMENREFMIKSYNEQYFQISASACIYNFTSILCDKNLTLTIVDAVNDPNIIGFIRIIEEEFHKRDKKGTFKLMISNGMDEMFLTMAYLIYIRLLLSNPTIKLDIYHSGEICYAEQEKLKSIPSEHLLDLYTEYVSRLSKPYLMTWGI